MAGKRSQPTSSRAARASTPPSRRPSHPSPEAVDAEGRRTSRHDPGSWLDRDWLWICLHLLVFLVPLATSNLTWLRVLPGVGPVTAFTADQFDLVKMVLMRALALVGLGVWGWRLLRHGERVRHTRADWLILVFLGWVVVTTVLSIHVPTAVFGKYRRFEGLLSFLTYAAVFFLTVQSATSALRRRSLARTFFLSSTLVALYGVMQYLGWDPLLWGNLTFGSNRGFSTMGNPNFLGGLLVLALPLAAALALTEQDTRWRIGYWAGFLIIMGGWLTAFTRGAWIAGALALVVLGVAAFSHRVRPVRVDWAFLGVTVAAGLAVVLRSLSSTDDVTNVATRLRSIFIFNQGSGYTRGLIWRAAVEAIKDRPVQGAGADTFRLLYPKYKSVEYVQAVGHKEVADNAHNYVLQIASTLGLVGAALLYGLFGWMLWLSAPRAFSRSGGSEGLLLAGLWAGALGYIIHLFFGISVTGSTVMLWVFLALLLAPVASSRWVKAPSWGTPAAVALIVLVVMASAANLTQAVADHYYVGAGAARTAAEQVEAARRATRWNPWNDQYRSEIGYQQMGVMAEWLNQAGAAQRAGQDPSAAIMGARAAFVEVERALKAAIERSPLEYDNYAALSQAYNWAADFDPSYIDDALATARRGIEVSPFGPMVHLQLAAASVKAADFAGAEREALEAARLDPRFAEPRGLLGDIYRRQGRLEEARAAFAEALAIDPSDAQARLALAQIEASLTAQAATTAAGG